jgi:hypothetical protein
MEMIIHQAEKRKKGSSKVARKQEQCNLALADILESYKHTMSKKGVSTLNETHFYSFIIKLSLNQHGKTWMQCLQYERIVKIQL